MPEPGRLRIATFNIRHAAPKDSYRGLPDKLAESCAELDADILGLQEVDVGVPRSGYADLPKVAAEACGMSYYFAKARRHAGRGQYGNAILVRGRIEDVQVVTLAGDHRHTVRLGRRVIKPFREPRNAIVATAVVRQRRVSIATGHFAADPSARHAQLSRAASSLAARPAPRALLGDFNIPWRQAADWLEPYGLKLAEALLTLARPELHKGIDHVALEGLAVHHVETRWLPISDHPAKIVDLSFPED